MVKYIPTYPFVLFDRIQEGKTIYFVDKKLHDCGALNRLSVADFAVITRDAKTDSDRYEFWYEEPVVEVVEVEEEIVEEIEE